MVQIYESRLGVGATGDNVKLEIGERIKYELLDGTEINATVSSERLTHKQCPTYGYECIDEDDELFFADGVRIHFTHDGSPMW